jgi:hypothetical protein
MTFEEQVNPERDPEVEELRSQVAALQSEIAERKQRMQLSGPEMKRQHAS